MVNSCVVLLCFLPLCFGIIRPISDEHCEEEEHPKDQGNCSVGWKSWPRPSGEWCMKVFYENSITQPTAVSRCQEKGATLSGFQNQLESFWVTWTASTKIYPESGSIWVGLKRKPECLSVGRTNECPGYGSFDWMDNSATGVEGMQWSSGQPDNAFNRTQACVVIAATANRTTLPGYPVGTLDDVGCEFDFIEMGRKPRDIKGYVCGKRP